jgi:hypothetical protein
MQANLHWVIKAQTTEIKHKVTENFKLWTIKQFCYCIWTKDSTQVMLLES